MSYERINGTRIKNWLNANYSFNNQPFQFVSTPPVVPEAPNPLGIVTLLPGRGMEDEKLWESRAFRLMIRSVQNMPEMAETVAIEVDTLLHTMDMPWNCDGALVRELYWTGGGPSPLPFNMISYRYTWTCDYSIISATGF